MSFGAQALRLPLDRLLMLDDARPWVVRLVQPGERYGLNDCKLNEGQTLVEFYDASYAGDEFGPLGQFVSRYEIGELRRHGRGVGLVLHGGVPVWSLSAAASDRVLDWLGC